MNIENEIKKQWLQNPGHNENVHQEITRDPGNIYKKGIGLIVFGAAIVILELIFFYISTSISSRPFRGLGIMVGTLMLRFCMEFVIKKRKFPVDEALIHYKEQLMDYYRTRKYMYLVMAPLLLAGYIYGFTMLLSIFEKELLGELYGYIIFSSWIVFLGLTVLIGIQLRTELEILKSLIE
ncbi:hypothetical protein [Salinimicrobium sp. TH3]|uniref:hypothetical protein n=1 Tax=Salinimicrobium sp. TH3 TaxID=2997342 RepID=UPI002272EA41|nr:hypothetical protein [Salinimicrobium sp. TH3]MCY2688594.1 hypothetical protein [Salinimicrobium sp. TH3]